MDPAFQRAIWQKLAEIKYVTLFDAAIPCLESAVVPMGTTASTQGNALQTTYGPVYAFTDVPCRNLSAQQWGLVLQGLAHP